MRGTAREVSKRRRGESHLPASSIGRSAAGEAARGSSATALTVRLGILGGTFDPPHIGHLLAGIDALEYLGLDRLAYVPASVQPLKTARACAAGTDRLE